MNYFLPTAREGNVFRISVYPQGGVCLQRGESASRKWVCLQGGGLPLVLTSTGGHCSGRYASYLNAFLFYTEVVFNFNFSKLGLELDFCNTKIKKKILLSHMFLSK